MPRVRLVRHSLRRLPAPLRPPRKGHQGFGNCFSAVLQFPKIPLVFAPSRNWRVGRSLGNWDSGIGLMMDVPSAAFVIRSFARHSVGHSGMEYNERGAGIRRRRSLPVVLFPFTNHDAASVASPLKCAFGGTRQFSWLLAALNAAIAASALAFIAVCGSIDFWPEQIDILTEALVTPGPTPPLHLRRDQD